MYSLTLTIQHAIAHFSNNFVSLCHHSCFGFGVRGPSRLSGQSESISQPVVGIGPKDKGRRQMFTFDLRANKARVALVLHQRKDHPTSERRNAMNYTY